MKKEVRNVEKTFYVAEDGKEFTQESQCEQYEELLRIWKMSDNSKMSKGLELYFVSDCNGEKRKMLGVFSTWEKASRFQFSAGLAFGLNQTETKERFTIFSFKLDTLEDIPNSELKSTLEKKNFGAFYF